MPRLAGHACRGSGLGARDSGLGLGGRSRGIEAEARRERSVRSPSPVPSPEPPAPSLLYSRLRMQTGSTAHTQAPYPPQDAIVRLGSWLFKQRSWLPVPIALILLLTPASTHSPLLSVVGVAAGRRRRIAAPVGGPPHRRDLPNQKPADRSADRDRTVRSGQKPALPRQHRALARLRAERAAARGPLPSCCCCSPSNITPSSSGRKAFSPCAWATPTAPTSRRSPAGCRRSAPPTAEPSVGRARIRGGKRSSASAARSSPSPSATCCWASRTRWESGLGAGGWGLGIRRLGTGGWRLDASTPSPEPRAPSPDYPSSLRLCQRYQLATDR